jgi:hypothetical protein
MIHEGSLRKRVDTKRVGHAEVKGLAPTSAVVPVRLFCFPSTVFRRWSGLSPTAAVERAHSDRARSGSKGDDPDYLRLLSFEMTDSLC